MDNAKNVKLNATNMEESIALPRKNGELVFDEPWEARAFGLAVALNEEGIYPWEKFSSGLAKTIGAFELNQKPHGDTDGDGSSTYYMRWLASLERLVLENGLITEQEFDAEIAEQLHQAAHDHDHNHEHCH